MRLHRGYALIALALLVVEILIALFVHDEFVRPYLGDTLAVILVYAGLRAASRIGIVEAAAAAFFIAAAIEFAQWFHVLDLLGLSHNRVARIVLGYGFEWKDFLAYAAGALTALGIERVRARS
ncbi:DUF2809 domain-containing protein [Sphingomonas psychrotolerans]|uniref:DUF2809 domain-containing protein n=1 Tax=Sphingomonas psychrotolerans TaxID=1327635 RepID=A0ABU3MZX2_9SPHN|nr:DUF2809 domain-containing protein [Sphingomonas psychrotolerans]MDT8757849.1 DUF2809 domain-containing protein [Sphingomonas psychrotolerans]